MKRFITYKVFKESALFNEGSAYCHYFIRKYFIGINIGRASDKNGNSIYSNSIPEVRDELVKLLSVKKYPKKIEEVRL